MNLRQLEAFNEVMLTGSVSEAARNMGRTQPALSAMIAALENSIGYSLFDRRRGRLHPVPEAQYLLSQSGAILNELSKLRDNMKAVGSLQEGHLNIACLPVFGEILMPRLISNFVKGRKDVSVSLVSHSSERVYERLASQQFDIGLAEASITSPLVEGDTFAMNCLCALPADDPLCDRSTIYPADLAGRAMTTFLPSHFIRTQVEEAFAQTQIELSIQFEMQNAASQFAFVEDGLAWAVMSPMSAHYYHRSQIGPPRIVFRPFNPTVVYEIAVLTPAHAPISNLARTFAKLLSEEVVRVAQAETPTDPDMTAHQP
ncbi:LysR substrate-binding domain-containing protein [Pseudopelagicola sp. nBUS_19]|uniref:LysR substrate-binding domain-containing protein n=1 Tax=Pseudopelagicola sp. nBUS_19 TaxID=3395316 RepID=UPI003EB7B119